jgi:polysaccharide deacetylase 2 family uncharacterized protein YibQ
MMGPGMGMSIVIKRFLLAIALCLAAPQMAVAEGMYWFNTSATPYVLPDAISPPTLHADEMAFGDFTRPPRPSEKHVIAIVIDDVGVDAKQSARTIRNLPPEVTLAFLPYARHVRAQVETAKSLGHEIIVHLPMEPESARADPGPHFLGTDLSLGEIRRRTRINLAAFGGYVGVNNHMGSRFTTDRARLAVVMDELRDRGGVMFLDSKTNPKSVAEDVAREYGLRTAGRDVFIDHVETPQAVWAALLKAEKIALKTGSAIAIGHPKAVTLDALESWIPSLNAKGIRLVTLTRVTAIRDAKKKVASVAAAHNIR